MEYQGIDYLKNKLIQKQNRVNLRYNYYEMKNAVRDFNIVIPKNWSFLTAVRNGAFTVPGDGGVEFDPVFELLSKAGYEGWLLVEAEQDPAKANPLEYAMKGRKYIAEHTGL